MRAELHPAGPEAQHCAGPSVRTLPRADWLPPPLQLQQLQLLRWTGPEHAGLSLQPPAAAGSLGAIADLQLRHWALQRQTQVVLYVKETAHNATSK